MTGTTSELLLRDIHAPVPPPWWPPAPGWWLLAAVLLVLAAVPLAMGWRRRRRRLRVLRRFDETVDAATTPTEAIAVMSALLRRAARRRHPGAATLTGTAWLALLDEGAPQPLFGGELGALLLDGGYRPSADPGAVAALRAAARARFLEWMCSRG